MKRAALALRIFGTTQGALGVLGVVLAILRMRNERMIEDSTHDTEAIVAAFKRITLLWQVGHGVAIVVTLASLGLFVASLPKGPARALAVGAIAATSLYGALLVRDWLSSAPVDVDSTWMRALWLSTDVVANVAVVLPCVSASRAARGRGGAWIGVVVALAAVETAVMAYANFGESLPHALVLLVVATDVALSLAAGAAAWALARTLERSNDVAAEPSGGSVLDGSPMRALGWALLIRLGVGVLVVIGTVVFLSSKEYSSAGIALSFGAMGSIGASLVAAVGLVGCLRMPVERRNGDAIAFALVAVVVGALLDAWSAFAANDLFGMMDDLSKATSFWSMPSLSDMERLQATLTWAGRGGTALGLAATFALVSSLRKTARFLGDKALDDCGNNVTWLVLAVGACAAWVSFAGTSREVSGTIYLVGPLALVAAIGLLRQWIKLLFGLANALDRRGASAPRLEEPRPSTA